MSVLDPAGLLFGFLVGKRGDEIGLVAGRQVSQSEFEHRVSESRDQSRDSSLGDHKRLQITLDLTRHYDREADQGLSRVTFQKFLLERSPFLTTCQQLVKRNLHKKQP